MDHKHVYINIHDSIPGSAFIVIADNIGNMLEKGLNLGNSYCKNFKVIKSRCVMDSDYVMPFNERDCIFVINERLYKINFDANPYGYIDAYECKIFYSYDNNKKELTFKKGTYMTI